MNSIMEKTIEGKRKIRGRLSFEDKRKILKMSEEGVTKETIMQEFQISEDTVRKIVRSGKEIEILCSSHEWKGKKAKKSTRFSDLETVLLTWFYGKRELGDPINGPMLRTKAREFCEKLNLNEQLKQLNCSPFRASIGWLNRFKKRHGIKFTSPKGEILSSTAEEVTAFKTDLSKKIEDEGICLNNIYNVGASDINYCDLPRATFISHMETSKTSRIENIYRIMALFCSNASGTHKLPVIYSSQRKAWADRDLFLEWFKNNFIPSVLRHQQESGIYGKVLLLIDQAPSHPDKNILNEIHQDVEVVYLPPNTKAILQPLDQGLIALTNKIYRKELLEKLSVQSNDKSTGIFDRMSRITFLSCFTMLSKAWNFIRKSTLQKAWKPLLGELIQTASMDDSFSLSNDDTVVENFLNAIGLTESIREDYRVKIMEWLDRDKSYCTWEPFSSEPAIDASLEEKQLLFNELSEKSLKKNKSEAENLSPVNAHSYLVKDTNFSHQVVNTSFQSLLNEVDSFTLNCDPSQQSLVEVSNVEVDEKVNTQNSFRVNKLIESQSTENSITKSSVYNTSLEISTMISERDSRQKNSSALNCLSSVILPRSWGIAKLPVGEIYHFCLSFIVTITKDSAITPVLERCVLINGKREMVFKARNKTVNNENLKLPGMLSGLEQLPDVLKYFQNIHACKGLENVNSCFLKDYSTTKDCLNCWRHVECPVLLAKGIRCFSCSEVLKMVQKNVETFRKQLNDI